MFPASCIFMKTRFCQPNCPRYVWSVTEGGTVVADDAVIMILRKKRDPPNQFAINRCTCTLCKINMFYFNRPLFTPDLIDNEFQRLICARYKNWLISLADPGGGRTRRAPPPPNGRGPMIYYAQNANFSQFFLRSPRLRIILSILLIEIWPKIR